MMIVVAPLLAGFVVLITLVVFDQTLDSSWILNSTTDSSWILNYTSDSSWILTYAFGKYCGYVLIVVTPPLASVVVEES